jgi:enterochelin esterase-like enzyme
VNRRGVLALAAGAAAASLAPARAQAQTVAAGSLIRRRVDSAHVAPRDIHVWLPPGYSDASERLPVLYAHDGQNLFEAGHAFGGQEWGLDETMAAMIAGGRVRPAIVVGLSNGGDARWREYAPADLVRRLPAALRAQVPGELLSDRHLRFVVDDVKPLVDGIWRTRRGREDTFILGASMGGLASLNALAVRPDVFGAAACLSTHWPLRPPQQLPGEEIAAAIAGWLSGSLGAPQGRRLYFDHGDKGLDARYAPFQAGVDALLAAAGWRQGAELMTRVFPGADHNEAAWRLRAEVPLGFLLTPDRGR